MAATWIKPLHVPKLKSKKSTIAAIIDYVENPNKTDDGRLIASYACGSRTADDEFMLSKREYEYITGRSQGRRDVVAYHIRQSFKPGEVSPEDANKIGYDLAMSFTKGQHAFVVCTHIDKAHVHNHIVFNSVALSNDRKFKNFFHSNKAIRRISDLLCAENGLSVIENPGSARGSYADWLGDNKPPSWKEIIKQKIDEVLPNCNTYEDFISELKNAGYTVDENRKYLSLKAPGQKRPTRVKSLGEDYTEDAIRARLGIGKTVSNDSGGVVIGVVKSLKSVSLLIDIEDKIREGKGAGYAQWAKIFNLKEAAKTLIFLKENGIDSYGDLLEKSKATAADFGEVNNRLKEIEARQKHIAELQKQIGIYGKTRDVYVKYKASGWDRGFYDIHAADIILHRSAKKYFDNLKMKKLPSIASLKQEYAELAAERKKLYGGYHKLKDLSRELSTARANAERILGINQERQSEDINRRQHQRNSYER